MNIALSDGASGGSVTSITMGYEFNLLGLSTRLNGWNSVSYPMINDALVEKEIPKEKETGFSLGKVIGYAVAGLAVVGAIAAGAAYAASVVLSGGATLVAAPTLIPAIIGWGTAAVGGFYVLNKAISDVESQQNSEVWDYMFEAVVGSTRGLISSALFVYAAPVKLTYAVGAGFLSGNIGSSYEQLMRNGNIDIKQSLHEGSIEGALTGLFFGAGKIAGKFGSKLFHKLSSAFKGKSSGIKPITQNSIIDDVADDAIKAITDEKNIINNSSIKQGLETAGDTVKPKVDVVKPKNTSPDLKINTKGTGKSLKNSQSTTKPEQVHHYATDKSKTYTQSFKDITDKYDFNLDADWNKELLPHQGRHPNAYHDFVLDEMRNIDNVAQGNKDIFLDLYESEIKCIVRENPDMLYSNYWKNLKE